MKKVLLLTFLCLIAFSAVTFASPPTTETTNQKQIVIDQNSIAGMDLEKYTGNASLLKLPDDNSIAGMHDHDIIPLQRGCCSWHKGVCGCDGGRQVCCDGSYSPTCRC